MDLVHRIWPRETDSLDLGGSFVERLKQLSAETHPPAQVDPVVPDGMAEVTAMSGTSTDASPAPGTNSAIQAMAVTSEPPPDGSNPDSSAEQTVVAAADGDGCNIPVPETVAGAPQAEQEEPAARTKDTAPAIFQASAAPTVPIADSTLPPNPPEAIPPTPQPEQIAPAESGDCQQPAPVDSPGPGRMLLDQVNSAVDQVEDPLKRGTTGTGESHDAFDSVHRQFEDDLRTRLDGALAEFERRMSSQTLVEDVVGQLEQRIRKGANSIFGEVQGQAWMMHNAVAGELRAFRDQFNSEIQERVALLDRSAQQALRMKESLEQALPKAEEAIRSLSLSGQEATVRLQAASDAFAERLSASRQELTREVESQKAALEALARDLRDDRAHLKEELESFQREAAAACEVLTRTAEKALERFNAEVSQVHERNQEELEKLAVEVEQRILSGGIVERATEQLSRATQEMVEPALDRIRAASQQADSAVETLGLTGRRVSGNLERARQEIESRLGSLLGEQLNVLESTMSGFQQKAAEDLGDLVERVVSQSTRQLDERLHGLVQDLFTTTNNQINGAARATLTTLHDGLKEVFEQESVNEAPAGEESADQESAEEVPDRQ